jgi:hypothetical protein
MLRMSLKLPVFRHAIGNGNGTAELAVSAMPFGRLV